MNANIYIKFVVLIAVLTGNAQAMAFDMFSSLGSPENVKSKMLLNWGAYQNVKTADNVTSLKLSEISIALSVPIIKSKNDVFSFSYGTNLLNVETDAKIPGTIDKNFSKFWDFKFGSSYTYHSESKSIMSANLSVGSASDMPFSGTDVTTLGLTWLYLIPSNETSSWLFLVNFSNNRSILNYVPVPGVAYNWTPSKTFRGTFGLPFANIFWMPTQKLMLMCFALGPWVVKMNAYYFFWGPIQIFSEFDYSQKLFLRKERSIAQNRLFYDEKKYTIGLKSFLSQIFSVEIKGGYAFGRRFYEAKHYYDYKATLDIRNSFLFYAGISARF